MGILGAIGSIAGYAIGGPTGAAIGGQIGGGIDTNEANADAAQAPMNFSASQYASRYQTTVKDLEAAGLSPMLAYSQGGGVSPTGQQAQMQDTVTPAVQKYNEYKINSAQVANVNADTENKKAQTANIVADTALKRAQTFLATAQEGLAGASADASRANANYLETQAKSIVESIKNIPKEGARLDALVKNLGVEYNKIIADTHSLQQAANQLKWLAVKTMLESDLAGFDVQAAKDLGNLGREAGQLKPVIDAVLTAAQIFGTRKTSSTVHSTSNSTVTHKQGK